MNPSGFAVGEVLGLQTPQGPRYYVVKGDGVDGPFLDRECTQRYEPISVPEALGKTVERKLGLQKVYGRHPNQKMTMSDGKLYHTDSKGVIHRDTPRLSKKERREQKSWLRQMANQQKEVLGDRVDQ